MTITGTDIPKVWNLRKAGLGVLSNLPGDAKPVSVIEDTSVKPELLPEYMEEFMQLMKKHRLECVYHAHIATGELHLRPILNLKNLNYVSFQTIACAK
ncbi:MAG: FAD-linked oxidase C-terminal domain-containing protein [Bacteroidales bacterium]|nr:FAD-linked oxidase C-terminal domain-containing protein [Bacteroidales bacterium]